MCLSEDETDGQMKFELAEGLRENLHETITSNVTFKKFQSHCVFIEHSTFMNCPLGH